MKYGVACERITIEPVTPLAGVWIEIVSGDVELTIMGSVTPLAGVWIEILHLISYHILKDSHSPCGSVD